MTESDKEFFRDMKEAMPHLNASQKEYLKGYVAGARADRNKEKGEKCN